MLKYRKSPIKGEINGKRAYIKRRRKTKTRRQAVEETIRICQDEDILSKYLEERKKEVQSIMSILFSQEEVTERYGYEQRMKEREATALSMLKDKMDIEKIAKYTRLTPKHIKELSMAL